MADPVMRLVGEGGRKLPRRVNLTKRTIDAMAHPAAGKRVWVHDSEVKGLAIMVTPTAKAWYFYKKFRGEPVKVRLGDYPAITPDVARRLAMEAARDAANNIDPRPSRKTVGLDMTLGQLYAKWLDDYARPRYKPRTLAVEENLYKNTLKDWEGRKLAHITEGAVRDKHAKINRDSGPRNANRAVQLLRRMFNFGRLKENPAGGKAVSFFPEKSRARFLQPAELPAFFKALKDEPNETLRDFFYACLYTGQRRTNVASMRWDELDTDRASWTIPGGKTKNGEPQVVHLSPPMLDLLKVRKAVAAERVKDGDGRFGEYVFPSYRHDAKNPHLTEPKAAWARLLKRAGIKDLHVHDLRRTLGSWQAATGASNLIIGKTLGHLDERSTAVYARLNLDPVRPVVDAALTAILAAAQAEEVKAAEKPASKATKKKSQKKSRH